MVYNHAPALLGRNNKDHALVAQMDRVLASEAKGRGFDSRRARHLFLMPTFTWLNFASKAQQSKRNNGTLTLYIALKIEAQAFLNSCHYDLMALYIYAGRVEL
jgi:hypothetical protein